MSRIFKSVQVVSEYGVMVEAAELALPSAALSGQAEIETVTGSPAGSDIPAQPDPAAAELLLETQQHVEMMLNQARMQMSAWQEEAHQAGREAAYAETRQALEAELAESLTAARHLAEAAAEAYEQFWRDNQAEVSRLAVAIAEKIIGKELTLNPKTITDIVANTLRAANIRGACLIRVNPKDYEIIEPYWNAIPSLQPPGHTWDLTPDPRVNQGGCLIEVGGGTIDAQLETQLEQVALALQS